MKTVHLLLSLSTVLAITVGTYIFLLDSEPSYHYTHDNRPAPAEPTMPSTINGSSNTQNITNKSEINNESSTSSLNNVINELSSVKDQLASMKSQLHEIVVFMNETKTRNKIVNSSAGRENREIDGIEQTQKNFNEQPKYIDELFEKQKADTMDMVWSVHAGDVLYDVFTSEDVKGVVLHDIECRASVCKVTVQHEESSNYANLQKNIPNSVLETFSKMTISTADEDLEDSMQVIYFAREDSMSE